MKMSQKNNRAGFTLIELLVVIAIIGLLATIVLISVNMARANGRDAKRLSEVNQIQKALELYYNQYGNYPISIGCNGAFPETDNWCNSVNNLTGGHWIKDVPNGFRTLDGFLKIDPTDPSSASVVSDFPQKGTYFYASNSDDALSAGQWYVLVFKIENAGNGRQYPNQVNVTKCNNNVSKILQFGGSNDGFITVGNCAK
jgi:prepilin-type N-terminal cleavage/methylation domain-containing protein